MHYAGKAYRATGKTDYRQLQSYIRHQVFESREEEEKGRRLGTNIIHCLVLAAIFNGLSLCT